jgi:hypothetical protein
MLIYKVPNNAQLNFNYVCDSQETIDAIPLSPISGKPIISSSLCSIGGEPEANTIIVTNQENWLIQKAEVFTVNLQTTTQGGVMWPIVNLYTEPANTDRQYFVIDPTTGLYTEAVGLDSAKTFLSEMKQKYLIFTNMVDYTTQTSWI